MLENLTTSILTQGGGEGKAVPEFSNDMNDFRYVDFFHANKSGHYKLMYVELGCLFDTDPKSASFRNLKASLIANGHETIVTEIESSLSEYSELVSNILTIRCKLIAHKEIGAESDKIHKKYGVVPDKVRDLMGICCMLINKINAKLFGNNSNQIASESDRYERATFALLEVLRNGRT